MRLVWRETASLPCPRSTMGSVSSIQADMTRLALPLVPKMFCCVWARKAPEMLWQPVPSPAMGMIHSRYTEVVLMVLEAPIKEEYLYPLTMQSSKMRQTLACHWHWKLRKCYHYSLMHNIAWGCNLHILRKTSDYFNMARRQTPDKIETEWKKQKTNKNQQKKPNTSIAETPSTHMNLIKCCPHWEELSFTCRSCAMRQINTQAI